MRKITAVLSGGAGFIGSHLCDRLLGEGLRVICVDNFSTGSLRNIKHLFSEGGFRLVRQDINRRINIRGKVDYCLHFASCASPKDYLALPIQTLEAGSFGTHNLLSLAKQKKAKFILASTSEVYGDPLVHPQAESYWGHVNPVGVRSCYDEAKRFAEALTAAWRRARRVDTKIARIFNTYGPRMRINDGRVVPNFIYQALNSRPITVYGRGAQTRSFCYIDDLVEGIFRLMRSSSAGPLNLGNPREFSVLELARIVLKLTASRSKIVFKPLPLDDPRQRRPEIKRAATLLKWQPKVGLEAGLLRTIEWFRENK